GAAGAVGGRFPRLGHEPGLRRRLVRRGGRERVERGGDAGRRHALEDERVEIVERADRGERDAAALRGARIHVVELREAGTVLEIAADRQPVGRGSPGRGAWTGGGGWTAQGPGADGGERSHSRQR